MRALVQRVSHASVTIDGVVHGKIGQGFLVLLGITDGDTEDDAVYLADKTVKMRVFTDENDKMNRSLADVGGGLLIVSQFTLYGDCLFTGDTLFRHECGRCDLEGGDFSAMLRSLKRLSELEGDYKVLPGHEGISTLDEERAANPYMLQARGR